MSDVQAPVQAAGLFQKAHGRIVLLQRIEAQIAALVAQRRRVHSELAEAQQEINDEFHRLMNASSEDLPPAALADMPSPSAGRRGNGDVGASDETTSSRMVLPESIA